MSLVGVQNDLAFGVAGAEILRRPGAERCCFILQSRPNQMRYTGASEYLSPGHPFHGLIAIGPTGDWDDFPNLHFGVPAKSAARRALLCPRQGFCRGKPRRLHTTTWHRGGAQV